MTLRALLSALGLWAREPKGALIANLLFVIQAGLSLWLAGLLPYPWSWSLRTILACGFFLVLIRQLRGLDQGPELPQNAFEFLVAAFKDSLPSAGLILGVLGAAKAALAGAPFAAGLVGLAVWLGLGGLLSLALAAPQGQPIFAAAWAGLLAVVAFLPSALAAAALASWLGGFWALWVGTKQFGAALLWAPLLLAPFFTPSFFAAYLYFLAQGIKDRSQGRRPLDGAPTLKEILRPWH